MAVQHLKRAVKTAVTDEDDTRESVARMLRELERYAVVGGPRWLRGWLEFFRPLLRMELRYFEPEAEASAWEWLGAKPLVGEPVPA